MITHEAVVSTTYQTYRQAAQVLGRAFVDEPVSAVVYRRYSRSERIRALTSDFMAELQLCLRSGLPLQVNDDGHVVAAATIYPPGTYPLSRIDQWVLLLKSVIRNGFYDVRTWLRWLDEVDKVHPCEPHYYLEYMGVDPERQGKGFGTTLLKNLVARADKDGVGCYLETASPASVPFYRRLNFQIILEKEIIGLPTWLMWRAACV